MLATKTKVGPVVYTFGYQEGVHLGDVVAGIVLLVAMGWYTARSLRSGRRRP